MKAQASPSSARNVLLGLAARAWLFKGRVLAALALLVLAKLAAVAVPLVLKRIVDALSHPQQLQSLPLLLLAGYALMRFASTLFTELRDLVFSRVTQSTVADFTLRTFRHLHALPARFHMQRATGALTRDVERGTTAIGFLLGMALFTIVPTLVEISAVLVIMVAGYALHFMAILVATFVAYVTWTFVYTRKRSIHQRRLNELDSSANRRLVDSLLNYETVKVYANEEFEAKRFHAIMREWIEAGVRNQKALTRLHVGQGALIAAGVAAVMIVAGRAVMAGTMSVGDLILINAYVIQVCLPLNSLGFVFREASDALVKAERLFELLAQKPEVDESRPLPALDVGDGDVAFEKVSFGYEPSRQVLWDVEFRIAPGHTVAVVGGSGSGKSTLARLLLRFYDVGGGRIAVNAQDVRSVSPASLRKAIGIVPQDTSLFNDTIAYNIAYGRIGAPMAEIVAAAKAANVHDFIVELPGGYDTVVGERGLKLSGGEKQRIAIARAVLKNPPIMIFDEATSALDTRSERAIQNELDRLSASRTTLVIAHRLSTVVNAHEILVLEHGRIVERGRHGDLLDRRGLYAQMWSLQQQEHELRKAEWRAALQPLNLATIVASAIDGLRPELDARHIHLYTTLGLETARVTGDPSALQQVVWDLIGHAIQVSEPGARVGVRVERSGGEAHLIVAHTGGPPLTLARPAAAADDEAEAEPLVPGTSHVFDIVEIRKVIEEHHGRVTVNHAKATTTYIVALPLRAVDVPAIPPSADAAQDSAVPSLEGVRVMVVDDNEDAREMLTEVLEAYGAQVEALASGREALERLRARPREEWPDAFVCDIGLPDEDGYSVVRHLRALEAERKLPLTERIPAIALTGHAHAEDRTRALLAGFQVHLVKPVDPRELLTHIANLLSRSKLRQAAHETSARRNTQT
jgi:ATP-binding cassette subfamily B protein